MSTRQRVELLPCRRRSVPGNSNTYFSKPDSRDPGDQCSRRGPDTKCRNSLAPMPYAAGRDLQVSDVLLTGGSRRHWQDRGMDPRRLDAYQKPHPTPCRAVQRLLHLMLEASDIVLGGGRPTGCRGIACDSSVGFAYAQSVQSERGITAGAPG